MTAATSWIYFDDLDEEMDVVIEATVTHERARLSGPWENSTPGCFEIDIESMEPDVALPPYITRAMFDAACRKPVSQARFKDSVLYAWEAEQEVCCE